MAQLSFSELTQRKENLRLRASEQRIALASNLQNLAPLWRWSKVGFMALGIAKGAAGVFALNNFFRGKKKERSSSKINQFFVGLSLARKVLSFFRRRD